eukprot:757391-Hanusia_phi.AAC.5
MEDVPRTLAGTRASCVDDDVDVLGQERVVLLLQPQALQARVSDYRVQPVVHIRPHLVGQQPVALQPLEHSRAAGVGWGRAGPSGLTCSHEAVDVGLGAPEELVGDEGAEEAGDAREHDAASLEEPLDLHVPPEGAGVDGDHLRVRVQLDLLVKVSLQHISDLALHLLRLLEEACKLRDVGIGEDVLEQHLASPEARGEILEQGDRQQGVAPQVEEPLGSVDNVALEPQHPPEDVGDLALSLSLGRVEHLHVVLLEDLAQGRQLLLVQLARCSVDWDALQELHVRGDHVEGEPALQLSSDLLLHACQGVVLVPQRRQVCRHKESKERLVGVGREAIGDDNAVMHELLELEDCSLHSLELD